MSTHYIGRFAPSPTGDLHLGSLASAVASYLDARANHGKWLVRIEDIDPPREVAGASRSILQSLAAHGLQPDEPIAHQSLRLSNYQAALDKLSQHTYQCTCTRDRIRQLNGVYDGYCRDKSSQKLSATRVRTDHSLQALANQFDDLVQGPKIFKLDEICGDFIIKRKDQLVAYQLAVVVDDIEQNITHVIRGDDLMSSTTRQRYLFLLFGETPPAYGHIPVIKNALGQKLSKQHHAPALDNNQPENNIHQVLNHFNMSPPKTLANACKNSLLQWAIEQWNLRSLHRPAST